MSQPQIISGEVLKLQQIEHLLYVIHANVEALIAEKGLAALPDSDLLDERDTKVCPACLGKGRVWSK